MKAELSEKTLTSAAGATYTFDNLVIATGSSVYQKFPYIVYTNASYAILIIIFLLLFI